MISRDTKLMMVTTLVSNGCEIEKAFHLVEEIIAKECGTPYYNPKPPEPEVPKVENFKVNHELMVEAEKWKEQSTTQPFWVRPV